LFKKSGSAGQDRTADLGVMNHQLGESLSFAFSKVAATEDFQAVYISLLSRPVLYTLAVGHSGRNLAKKITVFSLI
jgi:hypothetical protein